MIYFSITLVRKRSRVQASSTALERKRSQCVATSFFVAVRRGANVWVLSLPRSLWSCSQTHGRGISICPACMYSGSAVWTAMSCVVTVYVWP